ncbi:unnamed protein product [Trichogramma brassicae]|uniref:Mot1 central domain-containing protein n=1 Tax=Trichogramma brassicae TaxID=86971 RepID=A0A6H5I6P6_9HYME|nr:unnamed protein product [Trichogramma brassicae]
MGNKTWSCYRIKRNNKTPWKSGAMYHELLILALCVNREEKEEFQKFSAKNLAVLVKKCISRKPCPNSKEKPVYYRQNDKKKRLATLSKWQEAWDRSKKARWTHRLIPNIRVWIEGRHGELNYHLTQLLTGHGFFKHHSRRYDYNRSAQCPVCPSSIENAEHVFYHCPRFSEERERLHSLLYEVMTPENTTRLMLANNTPVVVTCSDANSDHFNESIQSLQI